MGDKVTWPQQFSWGPWIGGLLLALVLGCIGNFFAGLFAINSGSHPAGLLLGLIPGVLFLIIALLLQRRARSFSLGLLTGACVVALVGGVCGWAMVGQRIAG
jgi:hypothetical protein